MILSIDFRTDIPAFYHEWIVNRFNAGFLMFRNPAAPNTVHKVILDKEHIEGIIWCSKDYLPILPDLKSITGKFTSIFHYTITGYGKNIEPNVPNLEQSIYTFKELSLRYGKEKVIWRFDPIFYMKEFGETQTLQRFENICKELHNYTDRVIINFCYPYEKVKRNFKDVIFLNDIQKKLLIMNLLGICNKYNFKLQTCGNGLQFKDLQGVEVTGCLDEHALNLMGIYPKSKNKATEWGCLCYPNTSVGVYNTCMHKCKYCYASSDFNKCEENYKMHDPKSPLLLGNLMPYDNIIEMKPKLINTKQLKLEF